VRKNLNKVTGAGLLIALGIIYGDIGTSPLYVLNAIIRDKVISQELILGALSCVIWTLTLQTTVLDVIVIVGAWLIALALVYIVLIKFRILNSF
jgi:KUP system potassium uptake protein